MNNQLYLHFLLQDEKRYIYALYTTIRNLLIDGRVRHFLIGLEKYGKGDWRSISRNAVVSRTPTQVASHAQKYFLRLNSIKKEKKRSSIHDITTVDTNLYGQTNDDQNWDDQPPECYQGSSIGYNVFGFPM